MRLLVFALTVCFAVAPMEAATRPAKVKSHVVKSKAVKSKVAKAPKVKGRKAPKHPKRQKVTRVN